MKFLSGFVLISFLIGLGSVQSLTTFGKSQPNNQNLPVPTQTARGRDCNKESDCEGIQGTSCVPDPADKTMRCLCGDNKAPQNGECRAPIKGVGHGCNSDNECLEGGSCVKNNATNNVDMKVCKCPEGAQELNHVCNSGEILSVQGVLIAALTLFQLLRFLN